MGKRIAKICPKIFLLKKDCGFTLIEVIICVGILGVLVLTAVMFVRPAVQFAKMHDAKRKTDLKIIATALEDYLGDHPCYPEEEAINNCNPGQGLQPYLKKIPCDPVTNESYLYKRPDDCQKFVIYADLELEKSISYDLGNFVVTSPNLHLQATILPTSAPKAGTATPTIPTQAPVPTATPTTEVSPGDSYGCFSGVCRSLAGTTCQPNYLSADCYNRCGSPADPKNECR